MHDKPTSSTIAGERKHEHSTPGQETIDALAEDRRSRSKLDQCQVEAAIIGMLLNDEHQLPWTRVEVEWEMGVSAITTYDALVALRAAGLVHMYGELVIVSRAARRMDELEL